MPTIACIGFWLRRFSSFDALRANGYCKLRPSPVSENDAAGRHRLEQYTSEEKRAAMWVPQHGRPVQVTARLNHPDYDALLAKSVIFLDLIDASGVTTVVECLARGTPLLINKIPAVEEYLGADYPLYYSSLCEAEYKLQQKNLIIDGHHHLMASQVRKEITPQAFLQRITSTATYERALNQIGEADLDPGALQPGGQGNDGR
jgi:hypothetical protein